MNALKRIVGVLDIAVFVFTTIAIAGVFYEGMTLKWYDIVGIFVICMDYSFMPATVLHLITDRKEKWYPLHIFSMLLIVVAMVMKIAGIAYPATEDLKISYSLGPNGVVSRKVFPYIWIDTDKASK